MEVTNSNHLLPEEPGITKETLLLRLLDELSAARNLAANQGLRGNPCSSRSESPVDHAASKAGGVEAPNLEGLDSSEKRRVVDALHQYQQRTADLDACLQTLQDTSARLGSSMGILSASHKFRQRLRTLLISFRLNAEALHPDLKSIRHPTDVLLSQHDSTHGVPIEELPKQLSLLANDAKDFLEQITFFSDFVQDAVKEPIIGCQSDLEHLADCLNGYTMSTDLPFRSYVHQRSLVIGTHLQDITNAVRIFIDVGLPAIRGVQQAHSSNLLKLSTVATLFSGITAQAIQFSLPNTRTALERVTILLYLASLVMSISAAVNSLLSHAWTDSPFRPPKHKVPLLVFYWINHSPLFLMALSVGLFSAGLVCFCYYAVETWISNTVLILTILCHVGLAISFAWFVAERWAYRQHQGTETAMGALIDCVLKFRAQSHFTISIDMKRIGRRMVNFLISLASAIAACFGWCLCAFCIHRQRRMVNDAIYHIPEANIDDIPEASGYQPQFQGSSTLIPPPMYSSGPGSRRTPYGVYEPTYSASRKLRSAGTESGHALFSPYSQSLLSAETRSPDGSVYGLVGQGADNSRRSVSEISTGSRMRPMLSASLISHQLGPTTTGPEALKLALKKMGAVQTSQGHGTAIDHLQIHPDGNLLATCGRDNQTILWSIPRTESGGAVTATQTLPHMSRPIKQLAWSPDGSFLLTRSPTEIELWNRDGTLLHKRIYRSRIASATWLPESSNILTAEGNKVVLLNVSSQVTASYRFKTMDVNNAVAIDGGHRLLVIATLKSSPNGLVPQIPRTERCIAVYNTMTHVFESRVPILHDAHSIVLSHSGEMVLVSYGNEAPPQLWQVKTQYTQRGTPAQITYIRTYRPKGKVDFSGAAFFGGTTGDELVLICTRHGSTLVWDRDSGDLCHTFKAEDGAGIYSFNVAWNSARFMLASTTRDGGFCLWALNDPNPTTSIHLEGERVAGRSTDQLLPAPQEPMDLNG